MKEKQIEKEEEYNSQKRSLEIEERHVALELKKIKITFIRRDSDGTFPLLNKTKNSESSDVKSNSPIDSVYIYSKILLHVAINIRSTN